MPIRIFYHENGGILAKGEGIVTGREIEETNDQLYETKEKIEKILYQIIDYTGVEKFSVSNAEIDILASQDRKAYEINPSMLIAIVSEQDLIFGFSRMWEAKVYDPSFQTKVFRKFRTPDLWRITN